jgi:hypothetical protein
MSLWLLRERLQNRLDGGVVDSFLPSLDLSVALAQAYSIHSTDFLLGFLKSINMVNWLFNHLMTLASFLWPLSIGCETFICRYLCHSLAELKHCMAYFQPCSIKCSEKNYFQRYIYEFLSFLFCTISPLFFVCSFYRNIFRTLSTNLESA